MNKLTILTLAWVTALITAADVPAQTNSMVRFRISYGSTFFGDVDVELFDQDKPLTVSNFLAQVQSGAYDNSILHDLRPGFTLQGGVAVVGNPFTDAPFEAVTRIPTNAPVPNEFSVGTRRSNVLGTLAMAKNSGDTNSASTSWFFNLGNNGDGFGITNLDASLGGYTVFGQVKNGLKVLTTFNTFLETKGIQNLTNDFHLNFCPPVYVFPDDVAIGLDALPVGFFGLDCVRYSDLFHVQIFMVNGPDVAGPKVTILYPPADLSVQGSVVPVTGTVIDNVAVESVRVYLNSNSPLPATGTAGWSILLNDVPPGTNVVVAEAMDTSGNRSQARQTFFRSVPVPLTLHQIGSGTIDGPANGALLDLTRGYTLTAMPAAGYLFAGWTGTLSQAGATLPFLMESNLTLTAIFVPNPFPAIKGTYNGIFYDTNGVEQQSSGFLTLTLGDLGAYSAQILMNGQKYPLSGHFGLDGGAFNLVDRKGTNELLVHLLLDLAGGSDRLTGSITNNQISNIDTNAGWLAELAADRAVFNAKTNPAALAGNYTMIIPADAAAPGPDGDGFGKVTISPAGVISLAGTLADGTKAVQKVSVSKTGAWPLYVPLYKNLGAIVSWQAFDTNQASTDFSGLLSWVKQSIPTAKYYPGGFTNQSTALGSRYVAPLVGRVLALTDAVAGFTNGNLIANFANNVTLGVDNKILNNSGNALSFTIQKPSGLFTGSVTPPAGGAAQPFKGALLQKQNRGAGFFLGTTKSGEVTLQAP